MQIINNQDTKLIEALGQLVGADSDVSIACDFITSFAGFELMSLVQKANSVRWLLDYTEDDHFHLIQSEEESSLNFDLDRRYRISQVTGLIETKVEIRRGRVANQHLILIENNGVCTCITITPQNLDSVCLGTLPSVQPMLMQEFEDSNSQYLNLFDQAWNSSRERINDEVIHRLNKGAVTYPPESIYKYSMREIFHYSTISERADEKLQKVGFKDAKVWRMLFNFQKDAVIGAIEKIETYGGCIIADSVGLGKTFEALAVMKYYQLRNDRILVLAPKKLRENWTIYQLNDKRNILAEDRLNFDVLNHTDLTREKGKSGDIDLEMINWGNYDLVVIDESHNFRNNPNKREGTTRYKRLMEDVIRSNIRTKVLMLSATPVNNRMNDLKNQIAFITEGNDHAFRIYGIDSIAQVMKDTQRRFTNWFRDNDPDNLNIQELLESLDGQYFKILDMLTIARSRKHIEKYYDTTDIGQFPERLKPKTYTPGIDTQNQFKDIGQIYDEISNLTLASYSPLAYVRPDKQELYEERYDMETATGSIFKQLDREQSLIYLMRVNLLKRLESSIHSFKLTVQKLIELIDINLKALENHLDGAVNQDLEITEVDIDDPELADFLVGGKTKVLLQDIDNIRWKQDLKHDRQVLTKLLSNIELIDVSRDAKLRLLKERIEEKVKSPINGDNKKVIVFTAFTDTADYIYKEVAHWLREEFGLYSALVTGAGKNTSNMPGCRSDLSSILTHFSPRSKNREEIYPNEESEIDVLICTDCISEGQNLQDCDFLINYDIHWNPVRIIQRFGRIDRIGSKNERIQLVNFYPSMELDSFIDLVARVKGRMVMLDVSATGEDNIIKRNSKEMQDLEYRKRQLKQLQNQVIDLEDVQGNISISDLTFNDFKIDLEKSTDEQLEELNEIPPASFAVVESNMNTIRPGVIFCLKDKSQTDSHMQKKHLLYPYFLVYSSIDGVEFLDSTKTRQVLDYFRKLSITNDKVNRDVLEAFDKETSRSKKMSSYLNVLTRTIEDVSGVQEEVGLDSLATPGGTSLFSESLSENDNLELISYLIVR